MSQRIYSVLFICTGNSARSIFAESLLRSEGGGRFVAQSAGTRPQSDLNPFAIELLRQKGHDIAPERSVFLDDIARNLEPAAALGITTVWVAHDDHRARHGAEGDHVHHVTEDLAAFLAAALEA